MEEFHKVRRLPPYVFEQVNRLKAGARAQGADIIDLGMGNPDLPTPKAIVDKLCEVVRDPRTHRYSSSRGIPGLRRAQAAYYARRFGVKLDPDSQVVATLGSKEGFANMAQAITAPGDVVLCPNPTYPIHAFGFIMSGGGLQFRHLGSLEFSKLLIEHADVAVAPGVGFGEHGDDYVRVALVENEHRIRQAARNIKRFFATSAKQPNNVVPLAAHR